MPIPNAPVMCSISIEDDPQYKVIFESMPPQGIVEGYQAQFQAASGRGAPQPAFRRWTGGDWQPMQFDLEFHAGLLDAKKSFVGNLEETINALASEMEKKVRLLQAMSFPKPSTPRTANARLLPPAPIIPFALVIIGNFITYRGYITSTQITWKEPWHPVSARPLSALVTVSFQPIMAFYPDFFDAQNPQMRGSVAEAIKAAENGTPSALGDTLRRNAAQNELLNAQGEYRTAAANEKKVLGDPESTEEEKAQATADKVDAAKKVASKKEALKLPTTTPPK